MIEQNAKGPVARDSLLSRWMEVSSQQPVFTPTQQLVDSLVSDFSNQVQEDKSIAAMLVASVSYRWGRAMFSSLQWKPFVSHPIALSMEVLAFQTTHRSLQGRQTQLWKWGGDTGLREGLLRSWIDFSFLKASGHLFRSQNSIIQHLAVDLSMVSGHVISGAIKGKKFSQEEIIQEFIHASVSQLQMGMSLSLFHHLSQGKILAFEKSFEVQNLLHPMVLDSNSSARRSPYLNPLLLPFWMMMGVEGIGGVGLGRKQRTLLHSGFIRESFTQLSSQDCVLDSISIRSYKNALQKIRDQDGSEDSLFIDLMQVLEKDFLRRLSERDQKIYSASIDALRIPIEIAPDWMRQDQSPLKAQEAVHIIKVSEETLLEWPEKDSMRNSLSLLRDILLHLEMELQITPNSLFQEHPMGDVYRLVSPELLFFASHQLHQTALPRIRPETQLGSFQQMKKDVKNNIRVALFSLRNVDLHEVENVHPYVALLHDLYHRLRLGSTPLETRKDAALISHIFTKAIEATSEAWLPKLQEKLLDADFCVTDDFRIFFRSIPMQQPSDTAVRIIRKGLRKSFAHHEKGSLILKAFFEEVEVPLSKKEQVNDFY